MSTARDEELLTLLAAVADGDDPAERVSRIRDLIPIAPSGPWLPELAYILKHYAPDVPATTEALVAIARKAVARTPCMCCGHLTIQEEYDICPVCGWEADGVQEADTTFAGGANEPSLEEARLNYGRFGSSNPNKAKSLRPPLARELPRDIRER